MSKPRYGWWPYVKNIIRRYPALKEAHDELQKQRVTASYNAEIVSKAPGRPVERAATRTMGKTMKKEFKAVYEALEALEGVPESEKRIEIINLVYWRRSHTLQGAAIKHHVSYRTARRWHTEFIYLVAEKYGFIDEVIDYGGIF